MAHAGDIDQPRGRVGEYRVKLHCRITELRVDDYLAEFRDVDPQTDYSTRFETKICRTLDEAKAWCQSQVNESLTGGAHVTLEWIDQSGMLTGDLFA